ncbi:polysaccharide lyase [Salinarimonas ramus]|uniref:Polysaccharide lyase-like protein n=1 Tax=Salinarimonas ramus TaxID=690164 RepID=A0A917QET4_9HYPH|nr:polysaccharide lyase [Salinarimonas ramus]GGK47260.1 hypothetical protein GCM10011322_37930 [Salinarimonas ramus]
MSARLGIGEAIKTLAVVGATLLIAACSQTASGGAAFGGGGFSGFQRQLSASYSYAPATAPDGAAAERFELRPGDCRGTSDDCGADRERAEFAETAPYSALDTEYWYRFSVFLPEDFPETTPLDTKLGQFHQRGPGKPAAMFLLDRGRYLLELSNPSARQASPMAPLPPALRRDLISGSQMRGRWTQIVVNARWSLSDEGFVRVFVNGRQAVDLRGRNVDRDAPVYFKYGIYRSFLSRYGGREAPTLVAYYRDVGRARTRDGLAE